MMSTAARAFHCRLPTPINGETKTNSGNSGGVDLKKILLQPRLCTLRSYGSEQFSVMKTKINGGDEVASPFFEKLNEYVDSSNKSRDFEIVSGRLAMVVFAATVTMEEVTGNSLFRKMDLQGIAEAGGLCLGAVTCAALFASLSSARNGVGRIFTLSIDSLVDQIIDGLFYEIELNDWSDDV